MISLTCTQCKNWKTKDCIECVYCDSYKDSNQLNIDTLKFDNFEQSYLTPAQYEKRTGKKLSDNAAVWYRYFREQEHAEYGWLINSLKIIRDAEPHYGGTLYYVCAQSPEPPPDDYVPEGV